MHEIGRRLFLAGTAGLAVCGPTEAGRMVFTKAGLSRIEADLKGHVARRQPPGLVGLVSRGAETHAFPIGAMVIGGPPVVRDTIFRLASMTAGSGPRGSTILPRG